MKALLISLWLVASLLIGVTHGRECKGVAFPENIELEGRTLSLNGLGMRKATFLKVNVYVAALYVPQASSDAAALIAASGPEKLILQFVRNVGADDLRKAWTEGFERNSKAELDALQTRIAQLNSWMSDIKTGQRLSFIRRPGVGIEVDVNGGAKGTIEGEDFARAFLSIWLGATPPNPELKSGLLGQPCE
jgi:hypothetical protein